MNPVATGGRTSGSVTSVSSSALPRKRPRASSHARATPGGSISTVAASATSTVKRMICEVLGGHGACAGTPKPCRSKVARAVGPRSQRASARAAAACGARVITAAG